MQYVVPSGLFCIVATIAFDSVFWGRMLWPEGEVFWYNTYQNQSHHWGVSFYYIYYYLVLMDITITGKNFNWNIF